VKSNLLAAAATWPRLALCILAGCLIGAAVAAVATGAPGNPKGNQRSKQNARERARRNEAERERRERQIVEAARRQLSAAKQVLAAAESQEEGAKARLDAALARMRAAAEEFRDAQSQVRDLARDLAELESEILDEQPPDSPYGKASQELASAREKMDTIQQRILAEPAVEKQLAQWSGPQLEEQRRALLESRPDFVAARAAYMAAADEIARIRGELLRSDKDWQAASKALALAREEQAEAERKTRSSASGRAGTTDAMRDAAEAAANARATIARAEAIIRKYGDGKDGKQGGPNAKGNRPGGKGKK
jgi:chromosome segregation ATPase